MVSAEHWNYGDFGNLLKQKFLHYPLQKLDDYLQRLMVYKRIFQSVKPQLLHKNGFSPAHIPLCAKLLDDVLFKAMHRKSHLLEGEQLPGQTALFGLGKPFDEARANHSYTKDSIVYTRQAVVKHYILGKETTISFALNKSVAASYVVMEADQLQPSHIGAMQNPLHFIPEAQPRNRTTSQSGHNTPKVIAEHLRPAEIIEGATAFTGAPVINDRGEVIQGNGRAYTLKLYYDTFPNDPAGYKHFVEANKACYGFTETLKDYQKPVLVRRVHCSDSEAIELGQYTQKDLEAVANETTAIKSKVGLVSDKALDNILDELLRNDNGEKTLSELVRESSVLKELVKEEIIRPDDLELYTRNGVINETGVNFVTKFLLNLIFKDGDVNTPDIFLQLPVGLQKAVEKSALYILKVRGPQSINTEVSKSIMGLRDYLLFKPNGSLAEWKKQTDIFGSTPGDKFSPLEFKLIALFADSTTQKQIIEPFKQYAFWATKEPGNMFDAERPALSKNEALKKVFSVEHTQHKEEKTKQDKAPAMNHLFKMKAKALKLKLKLVNVSSMNLLHGLEYIPFSKLKHFDYPGEKTLTGPGATDVYSLITEKIISLITNDKGLTWRKPWTTKNSTGLAASNYVSKKPYKGANSFLLNVLYPLFFNKVFQSPYFLTFKQVKELGGKVKKDSKGYPIIYYTFLHKLKDKKISEEDYWRYFERCAEGEVIENNIEVCKELKAHAVVKYYFVFSADDIEGIDFKLPVVEKPTTVNEKIEVCEAIVENYPKPSPEIIHKDPDKAFYMRDKDLVNMPALNSFKDAQSYYSTLFHELIHSTGSPSRLKRTKGQKFGDKDYALEELVAELGACYLNAESGILYYNLKESAAYLKGWRTKLLKFMQEDPKFFFSAASMAQKAADFMLQTDEDGVPLYRKSNNREIKSSSDKARIFKLKAKALKLKLAF